MTLIICGTGHRPEDLPVSEESVRKAIRESLTNTSRPITTVISGMAAGFDLWLADEAIALGLQVVAARPWAGHKPRNTDRELYGRIIHSTNCTVVNVHSATQYPGAWVYHRRNEYMVDHSNAVLACWSGKESGGTFACIRYALKMNKPIHNILVVP